MRDLEASKKIQKEDASKLTLAAALKEAKSAEALDEQLTAQRNFEAATIFPSLLHLVSPTVAAARAQMCQLCRLPAFLQLALHTHSPVPAPDVVLNPCNHAMIVLRGGGGVLCKLCSKVGHFARVHRRREVSHKTTANASSVSVAAAYSVPPKSSLFLGFVYSPPDIAPTVSSTVSITDITALWHAILCVSVKPIPFKNELPHSACQACRRFGQRFPFHIELDLEQHDTHSPLVSICG